MLSIKGTFQDGVARPDEPVSGRDGETVIITFLGEGVGASTLAGREAAWDALEALVAECTVETGISDLAHQHDHYLHGKPKRD